jgi:beta-mannosidase
VDLNEMAVEWVNQKPWSYRVNLPKVTRPEGATVALVFEGLDTFAHVRLNGETILTSENMFTPYRVDITKRLRDENTLEMDFAPALLRAREIKAQHPEHQWLGFNGEMARLAARKAQYHWGWDWGPVLMTAGPWRPVRVEVYQARVADLRVDYSVSDDQAAVNATASAQVEGPADTVAVAVELEGKTVHEGTAKVQNGKADIGFTIAKPSLWYPHGYGKQTQYTVRASLLGSGEQLDTCTKSVGFRKAELIQVPDKIGRSFYFRINGIDTFCGGSAWIPADSFLPSISPDRYRRWLESMVHGNQIMVR